MKDLSRNAEQVSGISSGDLAVDRSYLTILWDLARGARQVSGIFSGILPFGAKLLDISTGFAFGR